MRIALGIIAALLLPACATVGRTPGFDAEGVRRAWSTRWNREAWNVAAGSEPIAVRDLACRKVKRSEFGRSREFRRARWCAFVLDYRKPDGTTGVLDIDRWLVGEIERRLMRPPVGRGTPPPLPRSPAMR